MDEISALSSSLQNYQSKVRTELGMQSIKQAAEAEQAIADMLAENAKAMAQQTRNQSGRKGGISIYI